MYKDFSLFHPPESSFSSWGNRQQHKRRLMHMYGSRGDLYAIRQPPSSSPLPLHAPHPLLFPSFPLPPSPPPVRPAARSRIGVSPTSWKPQKCRIELNLMRNACFRVRVRIGDLRFGTPPQVGGASPTTTPGTYTFESANELFDC